MTLQHKLRRSLAQGVPALRSSRPPTGLARRPCAREFSSTRAPAAAIPFDWKDPLRMRSFLTDDEAAISSEAERYCQERLVPRVVEAYRAESFDRDILREMGDLGLLGMQLKTHDCAGASPVAYGLAARAVERVDSGFRSAMSVQSSLVMGGIAQWGPAELQDRLLPALRTGETVGCFGLTEPNHGSDPGAMETVARLAPGSASGDGRDWLLSGSKSWITNSPIADVLLVWARVADPGAPDDGKIRGFVVERGRCPPGTLETRPIRHKLGLRASITGTIELDGCPVPAGNALVGGPEGAVGLRGPFACLNSARYGIAWGVLGALEDCVAKAREYALERRQFKGNQLGRYQLVQKKLADAVADVGLGLAAVLQVGRLMEKGEAAPEMVSLVKRQNCDRALAGARSLQEIFGGNAVADEYQIGRHVANLFVAQTYEGQSDIHALILGRATTGLQAFV